VHHRDISANVAESRRARAGRQARAIALADEDRTNTEWVGAEGGLVHDAIRNDDNQYFLYRFRAGDQPTAPPDPPLLTPAERDLLRGATQLGNALLDFSA
jgi:hypothetical protein